MLCLSARDGRPGATLKETKAVADHCSRCTRCVFRCVFSVVCAHDDRRVVDSLAHQFIGKLLSFTRAVAEQRGGRQQLDGFRHVDIRFADDDDATQSGHTKRLFKSRKSLSKRKERCKRSFSSEAAPRFGRDTAGSSLVPLAAPLVPSSVRCKSSVEVRLAQPLRLNRHVVDSCALAAPDSQVYPLWG